MLSEVNAIKSPSQYTITIAAFFMWTLAVHCGYLPDFTDNHSQAPRIEVSCQPTLLFAAVSIYMPFSTSQIEIVNIRFH